MTAATEAGAVVFPPVPSFYLGEISFQQMVTQIAGRVLDQFGIDNPDVFRWNGIKSRA